jgi:RNA polymerase sigma-70 factor, ECF subfamily
MLEPGNISLAIPPGATADAAPCATVRGPVERAVLDQGSLTLASSDQASPGEVGSRASSHLEEEVVDLFGQLRAPLLRYVAGIGLPLQDGEEIVQEVFLALFQHLQQGKSRSNLRGWIFRVAHNLTLKRRIRMRLTEAGRVDDPAAGQAADLAPDPGPNPEYLAVSRQTHARLDAVLRALPEQERQCLVLRAEGLRYREIAQILDMSLGAVSLSLTRSLARMARAAQTGAPGARNQTGAYGVRHQR